MNVTYIIAACVLIAGFLICRMCWKMRSDLRRAKVETFFYERLSELWKAISTGGQAWPIIGEGSAYIKNASEEERSMIRYKVYKIIDKTYYCYLRMLREKAQRILEEKQDDEKDKELYQLLSYNRDWLEIKYMKADWYGTSWYGIGANHLPQIVQGWSKQPNEDRKFLSDEFEGCKSRIASKKAVAEKAAKGKEAQERLTRQQQGGDQGFWEHMQAVDRRFGVNSVRNFFRR